MKCTLRPWHESDLDNLVAYANNPKIAKNLTDAFPHPYTRQDGEKYISGAILSKPTKIFAIAIDGEAIGSIGIFPQTDVHSKNAEIGYWLSEKIGGQGIMSEAITQLVEYAFRTFDITRIYARPFGTNKASQRVLEKSGFRLEAVFEKALFKNGEFLDEMFYAIRRPH